MSVRILLGDVRERLADLPSDSVDCVVTSPPYWGLRDYGTGDWEGGNPDCQHRSPTMRDGRDEDRATLAGSVATNKEQLLLAHRSVCRFCGASKVDRQIGLEPSWQSHVETMADVFDEVRRVLKPEGTLWLNYGDSYATSVNGRSAAATKATGNDDRTFRDKPFSTVGGALKPKDLCGIPWRVAFALQERGWWLRQDIIWSKPNPMPESVRDRCTKAHEYLFLLSKGPRYYFDAEAIAEPCSPNTHARLSQDVQAQIGSARVPGKTNGNMKAVGRKSWNGSEFHKGKTAEHQLGRASTNRKFDPAAGNKNNPSFDAAMAIMPEKRNRRSVWEVATQPFSEAHFATYPPALIEPCILAGCPECLCSACGFVLDNPVNQARAGTNGNDLQPLPEDLPEGTIAAASDEVLQQGVCERGEDDSSRSDLLWLVREASGEGSEGQAAALLQQGVRVETHCENEADDERPLHHIKWLRRDLPAGSSEGVEQRLCDGASLGDGSEARPIAAAGGDRSPSERTKSGQSSRQLATDEQAGPRPTAEAERRQDRVPALSSRNFPVASCPGCSADLTVEGATRAGVVLDPFFGAGTTGLVADRLHRNAIGIELNPEYAEIARRRIQNDAGIFADISIEHTGPKTRSAA